MQSETASLLTLGHSNRFDGSCLIAALQPDFKEMHFNSRIMTKKLLILSALVLMLSSCEGTLDDVFGEWDHPVAATISYATTSITKIFGDDDFTIELTNTGDGTVTYSSSNTAVAEVDASTGLVTLKGGGDATITATVSNGEHNIYAVKTVTYALTVRDAYVYYDLSTGEAVKKAALAEDCKVVTSSTTSWDDTKTLVVKNDVTIDGKVTLTGAVNLILCDGAELKINGQIDYGSAPITNKSLTIYAQSAGSGKLSVNKTTNDAFTNSGAIYCDALNIHGGKLEVINHYTASTDCDAIRVPYHDIMIYGGDIKAQAYSGDGIETAEAINVVISGGKLETIGGVGSSYGGAGINGRLTAKGNAVVIATGGQGPTGGPGVDKVSEISGNAYVESTGGEGTTDFGGRGFTNSLTVSENATVIAKGGLSTNDNGGNGASSSLTIKDNANVTAIGGNTTKSGQRGGYGVNGNLYYYGGKFTIESGKNASNTYYYAIESRLYNETADEVSFERKTSSSDWTSFSVDGNSSEAMNSSMYIAVRKQ